MTEKTIDVSVAGISYDELDECKICGFIQHLKGMPATPEEQKTYHQILFSLQNDHDHTYNESCRIDSEYEPERYNVNITLENYQFNIEVNDVTERL